MGHSRNTSPASTDVPAPFIGVCCWGGELIIQLNFGTVPDCWQLSMMEVLAFDRQA
jgi:hypothetical protein